MKRMIATFNVPDDNDKGDVATDLSVQWAESDPTVWESEEDYLADLTDLARAKADEQKAQVEMLVGVKAAYKAGNITRDEALALLTEWGLGL